MTNIEKNKITYIHFILSVMVILIHSINNDTKIERFFSIDNGIGQFVVPLFFIISGFLFFRNVTSIYDVKRKMQSRIKTLFLPYIVWNFIYYFLYYLVHVNNSFSFSDLYEALLFYKYNPTFWFMFELLLLIVITPIIYYALQKKIYIFLFLLTISISILLNIDIPYINEDAIIYFTYGAILCKLYNKNKILLISKKNIVIFLGLSVLMFLLNRFSYYLVSISQIFIPFFTYTIILVRLFFAMFLFYIMDLFFSYKYVKSYFYNSFLIYASHYVIVRALMKCLEFIKLKCPFTNNYYIIDYIFFIITPIICIVIVRQLFTFLRKRYNKIYNVLNGGR